ncbi:hypothetical protein DL240_08850 [Lujinxingia litoralis]|uniref:AgmX/PglI C-terminal domain-containing protein n=1 Tax=Lujinxingia litoralis TaxID=2211119 RepID=A0A328C830_9DELT|nr:AgmX/PglI C-terminal domain-containing protein [Lujinxingia litoralis]RAL22988.1 hypothetical protein DL240_08850 [Lujinxingia litoralis]
MRALCPTAPIALLTLTLTIALSACQSTPTPGADTEATQAPLSASAQSSPNAAADAPEEPSRILHRAMSAAEADINACYRSALTQTPQLSGLLQFNWQLAEDNTPVGLQVAHDTLTNDGLTSCVAEALYPHLVQESTAAPHRDVVLSYSFLREHDARQVQMVLGSGERARAQRDAIPPQLREEGRCSNENIYDVLYQAHDTINDCYDQTLKTRPGLVGAALARFIIVPDGSASHLELHSTIEDEALNTCITEALSATTFDAPDQGVCTVNYPIDLTLRSHPHYTFTAPAP